MTGLKVWLHGNKLSLNVAKTTSILIGTRHTINDKITTEPLKANFVISGEPIEQKPFVKYLGVYIDSFVHLGLPFVDVASRTIRLKTSLFCAFLSARTKSIDSHSLMSSVLFVLVFPSFSSLVIWLQGCVFRVCRAFLGDQNKLVSVT